jgi:hypothetical protein
MRPLFQTQICLLSVLLWSGCASEQSRLCAEGEHRSGGACVADGSTSGASETHDTESSTPSGTDTATPTDTATGPTFEPEPFRGEPGTLLFVTQVPIAAFCTVTSTFCNHQPTLESAPRGGALMIRYPDGTVRDLTTEAGYGEPSTFQGLGSIAVREPSVHWDGNRALFSMVIGAPIEPQDETPSYWQIYEVEGLAAGETASIRRIEGQPETYNNVSPVYGTQDQILFVSDRPYNGEPHLYPQLDEYESMPTVVGIYSLEESLSEFTLIEHSPSGVFGLSVDSFGRVIFTKWDHLMRDQQGDDSESAGNKRGEPFTYESEAADAPITTVTAGTEVFPEPMVESDPEYTPDVRLHYFDQFFPWEVNEDGSEEETLNHVGRHEFGGAHTEGSFADDPNLETVQAQDYQANDLRVDKNGMFHLREDPRNPGRFYVTLAPQRYTGTGGSLAWLEAQPDTNPEDMFLTEVTPLFVPEGTGEGLYRNPVPLSQGGLIACHTDHEQLNNVGSDEAPIYYGSYRMRTVDNGESPTSLNPTEATSSFLTEGFSRSVQYWNEEVLVNWSGSLWELDPVEVVPRTRPPSRQPELPVEEQILFDLAGVDVDVFQEWMRERDLALLVSYDVTQRDRADLQQPYNLAVPGGVSSITDDGPSYEVSHFQIFQTDMLRGYGDPADPRDGRRPLARAMHGEHLTVEEGAPAGAVSIAPDGSVAALIPAKQALSWQLVSPEGEAIVRERVWVSFAPGEIRVCTACHGINKESQTGDPSPTNLPMALSDLLENWSP